MTKYQFRLILCWLGLIAMWVIPVKNIGSAIAWGCAALFSVINGTLLVVGLVLKDDR